MTKQRRRRGRSLYECPVGREIPTHHSKCPGRVDRIISIAYRAGGRGSVGLRLGHGTSVGEDRLAVEQVTERTEDGGNPAGVIEIFHQRRARRLDVDDDRHASTDTVDGVQIEHEPQSMGHCREMNNGICRTTESSQHG